MDYHPQQIVWAKVVGYPYWPAVIIKREDMDDDVPNTNNQYFAVRFLGEFTTAWIEKKFICHYEENIEKYGTNAKTPLFLRSVAEANSHMRKQKDDSEYCIIFDLSKTPKRKYDKSPTAKNKRNKTISMNSNLMTNHKSEASVKTDKQIKDEVVTDDDSLDFSSNTDEIIGDIGIVVMDYHPQQIVWAKVVGYPYWPAVIIKEEDMDDDLTTLKNTNYQYFAVRFLGEFTTAWIEKKFICPYEENREKYCTNAKTPLFLRAVAEANSHRQKQKDDSEYRIIFDLSKTPKRKHDKSPTAKNRRNKTISMNSNLTTNHKSDASIEEDKQITDDIVTDVDACDFSSNTDKTVGDVGIVVMDYHPQQIVWAKVVGYPYWPAVIIKEEDMDDDLTTLKNTNYQYFAVRFLGEFTTAWIEKKFICPYEENREKYCTNAKTPLFLRAVAEANSHMQKQKDDSEYRIIFNLSKTPKRKHDKSPTAKNRRNKTISMNSNLTTNHKSDASIEENKQITDEIVTDDDMCDFSSNTDKTVGVVGIGLIGSEIVKRFIQSGLTVNIYNRTFSKCTKLLKELDKTDRLKHLLSARAVLMKSDIIFVCVSDENATQDIIYHEFEADLNYQSILNHKGIVVMTSTSFVRSEQMYEKVVKKKGTYLELGLQGSKQEVIDGTSVLLTAGDESLFHRCQSCFKIIGTKSYYLGKIGFAIKINLGIQMIKGVNLGGLTEGISLVEKLGVPADKFVKILKNTNIASGFLIKKAKTIIEKDFSAVQQPLKHMENDFRLILELSNTVEHPTPFANAANEAYEHCTRLKYGAHDVAALFLNNT